MRTRLIATTMALAVCMMGFGTMAYAADATKGVTVTGKAVCKSETKDGKTTKECSITVGTATGADQKPIADLAGKSLKVTGPKTAEIEKHADKEVIAKGTVSADKTSIEAELIAPAPALHEKEKEKEKK